MTATRVAVIAELDRLDVRKHGASLERWEPPKATQDVQPRPRRARARRPRRELPEIWLITGIRAVITLWLGAAVVLDQMRDQMIWVALLLLAGLVLTIRQSQQVNMRRLRNQSFVDLAVFLTILPAAVITGFVAAGADEMLPAERTAFLQLSAALLVTVVFVSLLTVRLFAGDRSDIAVMFLPVVLIIVSLPFVLHDYRNQTVLAMITVSYFLATVAIPFGIVVDEAVRRYIGAVFAAATVLIGLTLFEPGLNNLSDRDSLVQLVQWGFILLGLLLLVLLPHVATLIPGWAGAGGQSPMVLETIVDRRGDDSGGSVARRG